MSVCLKKFAICLAQHTFLQGPLNANNPFGQQIITYQSLLFSPHTNRQFVTDKAFLIIRSKKLNQILKSTQLKEDVVLQLSIVSETK